MNDWRRAVSSYQQGVQSVAQSNLSEKESLLQSKAAIISGDTGGLESEAQSKFADRLAEESKKFAGELGLDQGLQATLPTLMRGAAGLANMRSRALNSQWKTTQARRFNEQEQAGEGGEGAATEGAATEGAAEGATEGAATRFSKLVQGPDDGMTTGSRTALRTLQSRTERRFGKFRPEQDALDDMGEDATEQGLSQARQATAGERLPSALSSIEGEGSDFDFNRIGASLKGGDAMGELTASDSNPASIFNPANADALQTLKGGGGASYATRAEQLSAAQGIKGDQLAPMREAMGRRATLRPVRATEAEPTVTQPEPTVTQPEPTVTQPEATVGPEPTVGPKPVVTDPGERLPPDPEVSEEAEAATEAATEAETTAEPEVSEATQAASQAATEAETTAEGTVEDLAPEITAASSAWASIGGFLGDAIPMVGFGLGLAGAITGGLDIAKSIKEAGEDPYAAIRGKIKSAQNQITGLETDVSSDEFASKIGARAPQFGSIAASPNLDTSKMQSVALHI